MISSSTRIILLIQKLSIFHSWFNYFNQFDFLMCDYAMVFFKIFQNIFFSGVNEYFPTHFLCYVYNFFNLKDFLIFPHSITSWIFLLKNWKTVNCEISNTLFFEIETP